MVLSLVFLLLVSYWCAAGLSFQSFFCFVSAYSDGAFLYQKSVIKVQLSWQRHVEFCRIWVRCLYVILWWEIIMWSTWLCTDTCMGHCIANLAGLFLGWLIPDSEESGLMSWDYNYWFGGPRRYLRIPDCCIFEWYVLKIKSSTHVAIFFLLIWTTEN